MVDFLGLLMASMLVGVSALRFLARRIRLDWKQSRQLQLWRIRHNWKPLGSCGF